MSDRDLKNEQSNRLQAILLAGLSSISNERKTDILVDALSTYIRHWATNRNDEVSRMVSKALLKEVEVAMQTDEIQEILKERAKSFARELASGSKIDFSRSRY